MPPTRVSAARCRYDFAETDAEDALEKYAYGADAAVALLLAPRHTHKR